MAKRSGGPIGGPIVIPEIDWVNEMAFSRTRRWSRAADRNLVPCDGSASTVKP